MSMNITLMKKSAERRTIKCLKAWQKGKEYLHHKEKKVEKRNDNLGKMTISIELDKDIQALFNGLE